LSFLATALIGAQLWLGEITRQRPKKITFEEFQQSNGPSEIRPIGYGAGTWEMTPTRIAYFDYKQRAVERDSVWTDHIWAEPFSFLLDTITVAYRYYCAEVLALSFGPDTHVEGVRIDERPMFTAAAGTNNAGGGFLIDDPEAWGGDQPPGEGGQYSWCDITRGNYTDSTNAYVESQLTTPPNKTPSLRGVSLLVSHGPSGFTESGYFAAGGVGFIPRFREWKVKCRRQPNNLNTGFHQMGPHANPMEVWYEHSTSNEYGARTSVEELNLTSLQSVAQQLYEESNGDFTSGWSGFIDNPTSPLQVCQNILQQIDAVADPSPSLGLTIRLIRRDYSFASLPILNQSNITRADRFSPGTYEDTVNKVIVPFKDPANNFTDRPGLYIDAANQTIQGGRIVPITQQYLGIGDFAMANEKATRDGRVLATPRAVFEGAVNPSTGKLRYLGEPVRFEWSNPSFATIMRVASIAPPSPTETDWDIELQEDAHASGMRTAGTPVGSGFVDPGAGLDVAPSSAAWNEAEFPPDGLRVEILETNTGDFQARITGGIIFGTYAPGGQFARLWITEPGGTQTLSPPRLAPDLNNEAVFNWPALTQGTYEFCIQTFSLKLATNGVKVCAQIEVGTITGQGGSGTFGIPQLQLSGSGNVIAGGSGGFIIP
jgi:hypothetical protein